MFPYVMRLFFYFQVFFVVARVAGLGEQTTSDLTSSVVPLLKRKKN